ncbi:hypothetical protein FE844_018290 [Rhizobium indicum]|uniref:hypothetical protein n=1 Tax=Rhizobium indicum TaxID=2583231 RepID=UPI001106A5AC|nr:hypothetical protein [Rhizobium indicum]QKK31411.1 hypothetical protein FE844_018290 [Rhizobium indicum]
MVDGLSISSQKCRLFVMSLSFSVSRNTRKKRHEQLSVAAELTRDDPFDLTGAMLTTDELAAS